MTHSDQFIIDQSSVFTYTVRFQNTGTDTAFTVLITDTLTADLDPLTFVPTAASHPYEVSMEGQGTLKFLFDNIQLPDSNVNEPESHGFVSFEISPTYPVLPGEQIENIANIFFDFNPPVITDPNILVATVSTGLAEYARNSIDVFPNPTDGMINIGSSKPIGLVEVRTADGRTVIQKDGGGRTATTVNLRQLAKGIYILSVHDANGSTTQTVVKR